MKKLIVVTLLILLTMPMVFARNEQGGQGNRSENVTDENGNDGTDQGENQDKTREKLHNVTQIKERIQERKQEMERELESKPEKEQKVYRNQNLVRETVHNLLDMRGLLDQKGGIGQNVSEIAREFNNSVKITVEAEEKINKRSMIIRILLGGDEDAAEEIEGEVNKNRERMKELNELKEQIKDDEELRQLLQEQIQQMEQEQNRLRELAGKEKKSKGLFGWLFR